jgi:hypothetical protein
MQSIGQVHWNQSGTQYRHESDGSGLSCSCIGQLYGHHQQATLTRATIFSMRPQETQLGRKKLVVACGDETNNQCVLWDALGQRVCSRLNGQRAPILEVKHSSELNMIATISNNTCCLYTHLD